MTKNRISFIIPAYNEEKFLARCLRSILKGSNAYHIQTEIIVVDNGSKDGTSDIAQEFTSNVLKIRKQSVSHARNLGFKRASNDYIAFIDADVEIDFLWFATFIEMQEGESYNEKKFLTGAQCLVPIEGGWIEKNWFSNLSDRYLGGANMLTTKASLEALGGFDETLETGEDYDFCQKAILNSEVEYAPNTLFKAIHLGFPSDLKGFYRREVWHGLGDVKNIHMAFRSPVFLSSILFMLLSSIILIGLMTAHYFFTATAAIFLILANGSMTYWRFRQARLDSKSFIINFVLNYIYLFARFRSVFGLNR
mgnify:CR=1 FL=1